MRIINAETVLRDGTLYLHYTMEKNGDIKDFERPYYGKDGNVDAEVQQILFLAQKQSGTAPEEEVKDEGQTCQNLVVYQ